MFKRINSTPVEKSTGVVCDQRIGLTGYYSQKAYPRALQRVRFGDPEIGKTLIFLTNNFGISAETV